MWHPPLGGHRLRLTKTLERGEGLLLYLHLIGMVPHGLRHGEILIPLVNLNQGHGHISTIIIQLLAQHLVMSQLLFYGSFTLTIQNCIERDCGYMQEGQDACQEVHMTISTGGNQSIAAAE